MSASTIPYQLRPHKAIERNLFIAILKLLDRSPSIDIDTYRYVGFGAPFLEDFKSMHLDLGIREMDCIEYEKHAHSRQVFNNPYSFLKPIPFSSTTYITEGHFKQDKPQIIWLDFAKPNEIRQQLKDAELLGEKLSKSDVVKLTFNATLKSFQTSNHVKGWNNDIDGSVTLKFLKADATYQMYLPDETTPDQIINDFSSVLRAMAVKALNRGISKINSSEKFNHIASFDYKDGQEMTTITGLIGDTNSFKKILEESGLKKWQFYKKTSKDGFVEAHEIAVPAMTVSERIAIDKKLPVKSMKKLIKSITFYFGETDEEHLKLLSGYCKYYKYLPYYSKVIY